MRPDASFVSWQRAFAARIRDPRNQPRPPGVPARRMRVYEELLFNNLEGFLLACFPVTRRILGARAWRTTVRAFFRTHRCTSPLFRDIPEAFLTWMGQSGVQTFPQYPFLVELMHYEWLELRVETTPAGIDPSALDPDGDLMAGRPVVNPTLEIGCYAFPVHRIGPRFKPTAADGAEYCYLVYRDGDEDVRFLAVNPLTAGLVALLREAPVTGRDALLRVAAERALETGQDFLAAGQAALEALRAQQVLLGAWRQL